MNTNEHVKSYMNKLNELDIATLSPLGLISYGKLYGACYSFDYIKDEHEAKFIFDFIERYAKELGL